MTLRKFTNLNNQKNALPENMSESYRIGSSSVRANMNTFNFEFCSIVHYMTQFCCMMPCVARTVYLQKEFEI